VRLILLLGLVLALVGASNAAARTEADPVAAYKARVNASCRMLTTVQLEHIRAMKPAIAAGDRETATALYGKMISDGYKGTKAIVRVPVPVRARAQMKPILQLLTGALGAIEQALKAKSDTAFAASMQKADSLGRRTDPLLDAAGLRDCGSRQTKIIEKAASELKTGGPVL
jgi:hypothetical protein